MPRPRQPDSRPRTDPGGSGHDILFGDHGIVTQAPGTLPILTTGLVTRIETANEASGAADVIDGRTGNDLILGGQSGDTITDPSGQNIVFGDFGLIDYVSDDADLRDIDRVVSTNLTVGGNDAITTGAGNDIIIGGPGSDTIDSGDGQGILFGDSGKITSAIGYDANAPFGADPFQIGIAVTLQSSADGNDTITAGSGSDIVFGGAGNDHHRRRRQRPRLRRYGQVSTTDLSIPVVPACGCRRSTRGWAARSTSRPSSPRMPTSRATRTPITSTPAPATTWSWASRATTSSTAARATTT